MKNDQNTELRKPITDKKTNKQNRDVQGKADTHETTNESNEQPSSI